MQNNSGGIYLQQVQKVFIPLIFYYYFLVAVVGVKCLRTTGQSFKGPKPYFLVYKQRTKVFFSQVSAFTVL